mmetsp:Transcript_16133/g.22529  ORF Transcript_16133/g.22529 Transcript_16133/m.22529 type:complete len:91 (+) Transcript_16133:1121-1393(+)
MGNRTKRVLITVKTKGGVATPASVLAQKIGPLGLAPKKIGEDIARTTKKHWDGIIVRVCLIIIKRDVTIKIIPSAASLIKRELYRYSKVI